MILALPSNRANFALSYVISTNILTQRWRQR